MVSVRTTPASSSVCWNQSLTCEALTDLITGEVGKMLGEKWKALNEKQKAPYEAKAAADKKRYEDQKKIYLEVSYL